MSIKNPWLNRRFFTAKETALLAVGENPRGKMTDEAMEIARVAEEDMRHGRLAKDSVLEHIAKIKREREFHAKQLDKVDPQANPLASRLMTLGTKIISKPRFIYEVNIDRNEWAKWFQHRFNEVPAFLNDNSTCGANGAEHGATETKESNAALSEKDNEKRMFLADYRADRSEDPTKPRAQLVKELSHLYSNFKEGSLWEWAKAADKDDGFVRPRGRPPAKK